MPKNPLQIILELFLVIIQSIIKTLTLIFQKLVELFWSLTFIAETGVIGLIIACLIGGIVIYFISKFIFKNTKSLVQILLIYIVFIFILVL